MSKKNWKHNPYANKEAGEDQAEVAQENVAVIEQHTEVEGAETPSAEAQVAQAPVQTVVAARPQTIIQVTEKIVTVRPRETVKRFRCSGRWWYALQGQEMRVPAGVAEHMKNLGIL